jgi:hypothetical protein
MGFKLDTVTAAFRAAQESLEKKIPATELSKKNHTSRSTVTQARLILQFGTQEEIDAVRSGRIGARPVANAIRQRLAPEVREQFKNNHGIFTDTRREVHKTEAQLWQGFGPHMKAFTELPHPSEMVRIALRNSERKKYVNNHLQAAIKYMEEFSNEWTRLTGQQHGNHSANPGRSEPAVGTQHPEPASE